MESVNKSPNPSPIVKLKTLNQFVWNAKTNIFSLLTRRAVLKIQRLKIASHIKTSSVTLVALVTWSIKTSIFLNSFLSSLTNRSLISLWDNMMLPKGSLTLMDQTIVWKPKFKIALNSTLLISVMFALMDTSEQTKEFV